MLDFNLSFTSRVLCAASYFALLCRNCGAFQVTGNLFRLPLCISECHSAAFSYASPNCLCPLPVLLQPASRPLPKAKQKRYLSPRVSMFTFCDQGNGLITGRNVKIYFIGNSALLSSSLIRSILLQHGRRQLF